MTLHGGDIDKAIRIYGGTEKNWIDLSTGINPEGYPVPKFQNKDWRNLPTQTEIKKLESIIQFELNTSSNVLLTPGSQIAINSLPIIFKKQKVSILEPTYSDYRDSFENAGHNVFSCKKFKELFNAKIAIIVNPNNPDGKSYTLKEIIHLSKKVEMLIIDESFIEASKAKSIISYMNEKTNNIIVVKSFGKFFGLAGLRLGFIIAGKGVIIKLKRIFGTWPVSKVSIKVASKAIRDREWISNTQLKLLKKVNELDNVLEPFNFKLIGGTNLFRLYSTPNSLLAQKFLAKIFIWSRIFAYSKKWLRLGIPSEKDLKRIKLRLINLKI